MAVRVFIRTFKQYNHEAMLKQCCLELAVPNMCEFDPNGISVIS